MLLAMVLGLVVLIRGSLRITRSLTLVGERARWYGLTLLLSAIPFGLIVGSLLTAVAPESVLSHPLWRRLINWAFLAGYLLVLALLFRSPQESTETMRADRPPLQPDVHPAVPVLVREPQTDTRSEESPARGLLERCPNCGAEVMFITKTCPNCQKEK